MNLLAFRRFSTRHYFVCLGIGLLLFNLQSTVVAQVCSDYWPRSIPNSRYKILSDASQIKDQVTDLVWQRCSVGQKWTGTTCLGIAKTYTWAEAMKLNGEKQEKSALWRLPDIVELTALSDFNCQRPSINEVMFPSTVQNFYWSSTSKGYGSDADDSAALLDFRSGYGNYVDPYYKKKINQQYVRLVRSPCPYEWLLGLRACR